MNQWLPETDNEKANKYFGLDRKGGIRRSGEPEKLSEELEALRCEAAAISQREGLSHDIAGYLHTVVFELAQAVIRAKEREGIHLVLTEVDHDSGTMKFEEGKT